ncbi:MAG TPA: hypothetical protein VNN73_21880 [Blastocatellia bacterium]|nr:hypothetical protein [Blastocatellia bacterium]
MLLIIVALTTALSVLVCSIEHMRLKANHKTTRPRALPLTGNQTTID